MKLNNIYFILSLALCATSFTAFAQEPTLTKEITIETDFVPVEQKVTKPSTLPTATKNKVEQKELPYTNWSSSAVLPITINKFEPYQLVNSIDYPSTKGYVDFGIGTQLNIVGSAGYRIIEKETMMLNAWLQHSSTWLGKNSSPLASDDPQKQKYNDNIIALDFANKFACGTLTANTFYHLDNFNYYGIKNNLTTADELNQTVNEFGVNFGWESYANSKRKVKYAGELSFNHFGYAKNIANTKGGLQENALQLKASAETPLGALFLGAKADINYTANSNIVGADNTDWLAVIKATPFLRYDSEKFHFLGGVNFDFSAHDGASIRFSPSIKTSFIVNNAFSVYADITGGKHINRMSDYHSLCRYITPSSPLGSSYTPFDGVIGFKVGPFAGFHIKPYFAYGSFKYAKLPISILPSIYTTMGNVNFKGWKAGVELGYKFKELIDFSAGVQYAPQNNDKGYLTGLDRAQLIVNAQAKVTPIKPLAITLSYELRNNRAYYTPLVTDDSWSTTKLNSVNNLSLNAYYQVNKSLGAFVNASNLLNHQWDLFYGIGAQKINILAGVNFVF